MPESPPNLSRSTNPLDDNDATFAASSDARPDDPRLLSLAVGVVIVTALYVAREILIPIALAILLSFILAPAVRLLRRARLGRVPAVVLTVALALGVIVSLGGLIGTQISQIAAEIPKYAVTIENKAATLHELSIGRLSEIFGRLGKRIQQATNERGPAEAAGAADQVAPVTPEAKPVPVEVRQPDSTPLEIVERLLLPVIGPLTTFGIVFIVAVFILLQQTDLRDRFIRLFGLGDQHRMTTALGDAGTRLSHYLVVLLGLNVGFGSIIVLGLLVIGVPNPLLWGTLAALCRFVPYVGALVAGALPTLFAAAVDPGWTMAIFTATLFIVGETVMGQFVDPLAYGRTTGLSPVSVILMTIFWSWMWGPVGLILAMPLTVCLVVLGRHVPRLGFLEVMMGDRPALTPMEGFYQRILANDADETQDHAEVFLKDRPLLAYYDEVAIPGLRLAAHDAERGVLTSRQLTAIQRTMPRLLAELGESYLTAEIVPAPDQQAPVQTTPDAPEAGTADNTLVAVPENAIILCLSGRDILDAPVTTMLAQLLRQSEVQVRTASYEAASREGIGALDMAGVGLVCITYLQLSGSPSHLRYLIRRIRRRLPAVPILVGLWPADDPVVSAADRLLTAVGANDYATSLADLVAKSLAVIAPDTAMAAE